MQMPCMYLANADAVHHTIAGAVHLASADAAHLANADAVHHANADATHLANADDLADAVHAVLNQPRESASTIKTKLPDLECSDPCHTDLLAPASWATEEPCTQDAHKAPEPTPKSLHPDRLTCTTSVSEKYALQYCKHCTHRPSQVPALLSAIAM